MYKHPLLAAAATAALLALGACNQEPEQVKQYDPQAEALAKAAPVQLPPAITDNRMFRCSDNSLFYVDYYNNNTATIRTSQDGPDRRLRPLCRQRPVGQRQRRPRHHQRQVLPHLIATPATAIQGRSGSSGPAFFVGPAALFAWWVARNRIAR
jgi:hypothetical protein